eukprot:1175731-Prorocentrum_minimum.AAC.3
MWEWIGYSCNGCKRVSSLKRRVGRGLSGGSARPGQTLDAGRWTLDARRWTLDARRWTLDARRWTLDARRWTLDARRWTLDAGR